MLRIKIRPSEGYLWAIVDQDGIRGVGFSYEIVMVDEDGLRDAKQHPTTFNPEDHELVHAYILRSTWADNTPKWSFYKAKEYPAKTRKELLAEYKQRGEEVRYQYFPPPHHSLATYDSLKDCKEQAGYQLFQWIRNRQHEVWEGLK